MDVYLKIEGIEGESSDKVHTGEIEVQSFSWGVSQPTNIGAASATGGLSGGKASFTDLNVFKYVDKSTPYLLEAAWTGKHIPSATLTLHRATGEKGKFLEIILSDVMVSTVQLSAAGDKPSENLSLAYSKVEYKYTPIKNDGTEDTVIPVQWSLAENA